MAASTGRRKGRPTKAVVTRDKIVAAAMKLAEKYGYDRLTMALIARHMGVAPSALYNHVAGKENLFALVQDRVMGSVDTAALDAALAGELSARQGLERWAWSYRNVFANHVPLIRYIAPAPVDGAPETIAMYERVIRVMESAGVPQSRLISKLAALESFIAGSIYDVHAPVNIYDVSVDQLAPRLLAASTAFNANFAGPDADEVVAQGRLDPTGDERLPSPRADLPFYQGLRALLADIPD